MDVIASSPAGSQIDFRTVNQVIPFSQALVSPDLPCTAVQATAGTCPNSGTGFTHLVTLGGTSPNLKPQHGKSWSFGGDLTPFKGLKASLTYYVTTYEDAFANPALNPAYSTLGLGNFNNLNGTGITQAQLDAFLAQGTVVTAAPAGLALSKIYLLADIRTINMKFSRVSGLDYSMRYDFETGFGRMWASVNGTHFLSNVSIPYAGAAQVNNLIISQGTGVGSESGPRGKFTTQIGLSSGGFRGQVTMSHVDGFYLVPSAVLFSSKVDAWNQFGLFASYDFAESSKMLNGVQVSVTVNNLLNSAPPLVKTIANAGFSTNGHFGDSLGRVIQFGLRKRF
jgi:iron complex outermembrane recepter protein